MLYNGESAGGEFTRLPAEAGAPADAFFTEHDRTAVSEVLSGKRPAQPVADRLSYLVQEGVYPGSDSQAATYLRQIEGLAGYNQTPDL